MLKKLFSDLIWSDYLAVTPEKSLAETILSESTTGGAFGEQQDIHECMDNIMDMLECAFNQCKAKDTPDDCPSILHRLFYGKTTQTVQYTDQAGQIQCLTKVEPFHQLIVDVQPNLYLALDSYFNEHLVCLIKLGRV